MANVINSRGIKAPSLWSLFIGLIMLILGIYVCFHPATALAALGGALGVSLIVLGVSYLAAFVGSKHFGYLALGILDIVLGIMFLANLSVMVVGLPILFALWALFAGIVQIVESVRLKDIGFYDWYIQLISGIFGLVFSVLIIYRPIFGAVAITLIMGAYIIMYGALEITEYFMRRRLFKYAKKAVAKKPVAKKKPAAKKRR